MGNLKEISNEKEYKIIRDEIKNLKNCITNYLGFVLGGSGLSFVGFLSINDYEKHLIPIAFLSLILAVTISLVLCILFYKFHSHNRYAGYCKLLNQEHLELDAGKSDLAYGEIDIMSWEICVDKLRALDSNTIEKLIKELIEKKSIDISEDEYKHRKSNSVSWHFPVTVTRVFFVLSLIYVSSSIYSVCKILKEKELSDLLEILNFCDYVIILLFISFLILTVRLWVYFFIKLKDLMNGDTTVSEFCWKFLPLRYAYIKDKSKHIEYKLITLKDL